MTNQPFASYATSSALTISLSKRMVDVLLYLDELSTLFDLEPDKREKMLMAPYVSFATTEQSLVRRGLIEFHSSADLGAVRGDSLPVDLRPLEPPDPTGVILGTKHREGIKFRDFCGWKYYMPPDENGDRRQVDLVDYHPVTYAGKLCAELAREAGIESSLWKVNLETSA